MQDIRIDGEGRQRCWNCGSQNFTQQRTARSKVGFGISSALTKPKLRCVRCDEYNDVGSAKPYSGPADRKYKSEWQAEQSQSAVKRAGGSSLAEQGERLKAEAEALMAGRTALDAEAKMFRPASGSQEAVPNPPPVASPSPSSVPTGHFSVADELRKLADLKEAGLLSDDEFSMQKAKLLDTSPPP